MKHTIKNLSYAEMQQATNKMKKDIRLKELYKTMQERTLSHAEREIMRIIMTLDYGKYIERN